MSRHGFAGNGVNLTIGWDAPLATFYLQVWVEALQAAIEDEDERDAPQVWMGAAYGECPDHRAVLDVARRHVTTIPADFARELMADQLREPARPLAAGGNTVERLLNTLAGQPVVYPTKH